MVTITTLPSTEPDVLPIGFDPSGFVGELHADGQRLRVSAVAATTAGQIAVISLIGYETSVGAAMGRFMQSEKLPFAPALDTWTGPRNLCVAQASYWLWRAALTGTREHQGVVFLRNASIKHGLQNPPIPTAFSPEEAKRRQEERKVNPFVHIDATLERLRSGQKEPHPKPQRVVLADQNAEAPTPTAFFGHLRALRVVCLPSLRWVDYLWEVGLRDGCIRPLASAGLRAWLLNGDPDVWNALISEGVRMRLLPADAPTDHDRQRLHLRAA
jgi:hypothetical protein